MGESRWLLLLYYCRHSNKRWFLIMAIFCAQNMHAVLCSLLFPTVALGCLVHASSFSICFVSFQWNNIYSMSSLCSAALFIFYLILLRLHQNQLAAKAFIVELRPQMKKTTVEERHKKVKNIFFLVCFSLINKWWI